MSEPNCRPLRQPVIDDNQHPQTLGRQSQRNVYIASRNVSG
jgi:hypothetical protein